MKNLILVILLLNVSIVLSQEQKEIPLKKSQFGFAQLDFLSVKMPDPEEKNMTLTGIHYNVMLNKYSYAGVGLYGAVSGERGGFFGLGINAGIKQNITNHLFVDAGLHFGGGGGALTPDGGGAYIIPHANLGYHFKPFDVTLGYSYINFFDYGKIKSHQFNAAIQIPLSFDYADFTENGNDYSIEGLKETAWNQPSNRFGLFVHFDNLSFDENSQFKQNTTIRLAGFEIQSYFRKNWFYFIKADGAYSGIPSGYMDVFVGPGYHLSMNKNRTNILAKFGVGAGGGGGVDTKGGFLINPDISLEQKVLKNIYLTVNKGFMLNFDKSFNASTFGFGLKYLEDINGISSEGNTKATAEFKGVEVIIAEEIYFNVQRMYGKHTQNMNQISVEFNFFLNKNIYAAGQTSFANFGNAGAYAEGTVGLGVETNRFFDETTTVFAQILGGAAGGGDINTGEGFVIKPSTGLNFKVSDKLNLHAAVGYVKTHGGDLNNTFVNFGINYNFSLLSAR
ncbi:hypothetical protein [Flavobacterium sp. WC2509]|uniref:hypothetical protein n=1 Tax=Flavobacterium sp. WC2509 TaxID=3461406 RepID=UPI0040444D9D